MNTSLTTPEDRTEKMNIDPSEPDLSKDELKHALKELDDTTAITKYRKTERRYADVPIHNQTYGLVSFVPAKGATPNEKGIFGFAKLRGNFATVDEAGLHAQEIIKKSDSYHKIYTTYVGRPFPITVSSDFSKDIDEVQMNNEVAQTYSADVKAKREKEAKDIAEIQAREKNLTAEVKREAEDPLEHYTTLQVKRANLIWTYKKTEEKMSEMRASIIKTRKELAELDKDDDALKEKYFKNYMDARDKAGLTREQHTDNFIKYMCEDIELDFLREDHPHTYEDLQKQVSILKDDLDSMVSK